MKSITIKLVTALVIFVSNITFAFADGYGHVPVDTAFEIDIKTVSAFIAIVLFVLGSTFIIEGLFFKNTTKTN